MQHQAQATDPIRLHCLVLVQGGVDKNTCVLRQRTITPEGVAPFYTGRVVLLPDVMLELVMTLQEAYELLVGADGAGSIVRSALQQVLPAGYLRRYTHAQVYSMSQVTPSSPEEIPPHAIIQAHAAKVSCSYQHLYGILSFEGFW